MLEADLIGLAAATIHPEDNTKLAQFFKVPLDANGFFLEAHMKLRPVDFATDGVFLCGLAHNPKTIDESIDQALAASSRAALLLSKEILICEGTVAHIDESVCSGCRTCLNLCPFGAISYIEEKRVCQVNEALCKGCGTCAAACPSQAITARQFTIEELMSQVEAFAGVA